MLNLLAHQFPRPRGFLLRGSAKLIGWNLEAPDQGAFRAPERPSRLMFPEGFISLTSGQLVELEALRASLRPSSR